ncbi:hypothetical protein DCO58_10975 [Helicobacter saguini]|uniref:acylphosphatase n=1 Tax=Helicobacter saguini TaxID=1548018 RepID=A0A347VPW6_9HELI|nr:acylphosphatase [Helicobacter saguini]MWV61183.1 hypothetical protein [Helicobacter saguini]MWV68150.1 hypothetical protein [Helicobacter saguini]MWV70387.1 hypothetical protein [Helicobacter saguini]MWV72288.1 hypothetical protein [Helicobacter saguini]TLD95327.1 acylphosphatase [Helicobacter saguini]
MRHFKIIAKGKVQGVGYRNFTYKYATSKNLLGSVKNLSDGSVEIFVSLQDGAILGDFLESLLVGNGRMETKSFEITILENLNFSDFRIIE